MKKLALFSFALTLALCLASCGGTPKLQEFKSEAGRFSVMVPEALQETSQALETQAGKIDLHLFSIQQDRTGYFVSYCDYPQELIQQSSPERMLDGARDGAVGNVEGKLVLESKITLAGHPGREVVIDGRPKYGQKVTIKGRMFMVKNRLYQVTVVAPQGQAGGKVTDAFLQSFKLLG
jgi:hypothetical protein